MPILSDDVVDQVGFMTPVLKTGEFNKAVEALGSTVLGKMRVLN